MRDWLLTINAKPATEKGYLRALQEFTEFAGKIPNELIEEAEAEAKKGISPRERTIKRHVTGFRRYLQDEKYAPHKRKTLHDRPEDFFISHDIEYPKLPRAGNRAQTLEENNEIPTKEDIQACLRVADPLRKQ